MQVWRSVRIVSQAVGNYVTSFMTSLDLHKRDKRGVQQGAERRNSYLRPSGELNFFARKATPLLCRLSRSWSALYALGGSERPTNELAAVAGFTSSRWLPADQRNCYTRNAVTARLRRVRAERLQPVLNRRGGRVVTLTGDGTLFEASLLDRQLPPIECKGHLTK